MNDLIEAATAPYRAAGRFAYHFARGKLRADPVFATILSRGLLSGCDDILDLGCGQGLLAAWLLAARAVAEGHSRCWPNAWPSPPQPTLMRGIELEPRSLARARIALGHRARFFEGDVRRADFGNADGIVLLDVLHYIEYAAQRSILERAHRSLTASGVLLLRVGDAAGGLGFHMGKWVDRMLLLAGGRGLRRLHYRPLPEWRTLLEAIGFDCESLPMSSGTPFANVLLVATPRGAGSGADGARCNRYG
jgi:SAM-dependent methyltransferase